MKLYLAERYHRKINYQLTEIMFVYFCWMELRRKLIIYYTQRIQIIRIMTTTPSSSLSSSFIIVEYRVIGYKAKIGIRNNLVWHLTYSASIVSFVKTLNHVKSQNKARSVINKWRNKRKMLK